jgi:hypothetical protein
VLVVHDKRMRVAPGALQMGVVERQIVMAVCRIFFTISAHDYYVISG